MKKTELIQKAVERFSNLPQDVAVVLRYKGEMFSIVPNYLDSKRIIEGMKMKKAYAMVYGEIIQEEQELCKNPNLQYMTARAEAPVDLFRIGSVSFDYDVYIEEFKAGNGWDVGHKVKLAVPSNMSLVEIKEHLANICDKHDIYNCHILIQSVDYPVFEGMRDRDTPQPNWKEFYEKDLVD